jgi:hypothetical protein
MTTPGEQFKTTKEWLSDITSRDSTDWGNNNQVYQIPGTDYLLRAPNRKGSAFHNLKHTSTLTPVHLAVGEPYQAFGENVGQALLTVQHADSTKDGTFSITRRIKGTNLEKLKDQIGEDALTEQLCNLPDEAWKQLFKQLIKLTDQGILVDFQGRNILLNQEDKTLSLIDVEPESDFLENYNNWGYCRYALGDLFDKPSNKECIFRKMDDCAVGIEGLRSLEAIEQDVAKGRIAFARQMPLKDPDAGAPFALSEPPQAFVDKLQAIEKHLGWSRP